MSNDYQQLARAEHKQKLKLGKSIGGYYTDKLAELKLDDFSRIKAYLQAGLNEQSHLISRDIIFAHMGFEPFTAFIANGEPFAVVSGLNPSSSLHIGHKLMFDMLLFLQKLGGDIYIPITNDESYVDGKVTSLAESRRIAYEEVIPSILAFGFDPKKTHIYVMSDYPDMYNFAIDISRHVTNKYVATVFGEEGVDNSGKAFYRSAVQLGMILMPQLKEFGGKKPVLIPVGIDQHPYVLVARDVAKRMGFVQPAEVIFKFQGSLIDPSQKMSGSKPKTAIYLSDTPEVIASKIKRAYTGSVSSLDVHKKLGAVPEACSVFSLLYLHHPDDAFVQDIYDQYKSGQLTSGELKEITTAFITDLVLKHQVAKSKIKSFDKFILNTPLRSFL